VEADADTGLVRIVVPAGNYSLTTPAPNDDDATTGDLNLTNVSGGIEIAGAGAGGRHPGPPRRHRGRDQPQTAGGATCPTATDQRGLARPQLGAVTWAPTR
jgi:hypothetical protein